MLTALQVVMTFPSVLMSMGMCSRVLIFFFLAWDSVISAISDPESKYRDPVTRSTPCQRVVIRSTACQRVVTRSMQQIS